MVRFALILLISVTAYAGPRGVNVGLQEPRNEMSCRAIGSGAGKVASINVALNYDGLGGLKLGAAPEFDMKFFQRMSQGFKPTRTGSITNSDLDQSGKEGFLRKLKSTMGDAKYVNFNFSGHGVVLNDGEPALLLPGGDYKMYLNCFGRAIKGGLEEDSGKNYDCSKMQNYFVRASELKQTFAGRKVFGILDNCYAGGFDLGENSSMLMAAQADQIAKQNSRQFGGDFSNKLKGMIDTPCDYDLRPDASLYEIMSAIHSEKASTLPKQTEKVDNRAWTRCFIPKSEGPKECKKSFSAGQPAVTSQAVTATANGNPCNIPAGAAVQPVEDTTGSRGMMAVKIVDGKVATDCGSSQVQVPIEAVRSAPAVTNAKPNSLPANSAK